MCCGDRFGDNDVEVAAAGWDDGAESERPTASYMPLSPTVAVRHAAAADM